MLRIVGLIAVVLSLGGCALDGSATTAGGSEETASAGTAPSTGQPMDEAAQVVFLHHSTGAVIWDAGVAEELEAHNAEHQTSYQITEREFPGEEPYGWSNYPYDYWNIWVNHAGAEPYQEEPTLELLTADYDVVMWKHCFPVSDIAPDTGDPDPASADRRLENYQAQYLALRERMREFPETRFVVWTAAARTQASTDPATAARAEAFVDWVRDSWDEPGDNIFLWDFWELETGGGQYLAADNASGASDSHPNATFAARVAPLLTQRVIDVIEGRGDSADLAGEDTS